MSMKPIRDFAPGEFGLAEAVNDDGSATYMLYRREAEFPKEYAERPRLHPMLVETCPTTHLRTWKPWDGGARFDSGLPRELVEGESVEYAIPVTERPKRVWGTSPAFPMLPVKDWKEAQVLAAHRARELAAARDEGRRPEKLKATATRVR